VSLTGEERELVIAPVPNTLQTDSVRVSGTGNVAVRLHGARNERIFSTEPVTDRLAQLTRQIQQLESECLNLQAQVNGLTLQSQFIEGLRDKTQEPFAQSLSRKNLSLSETLDFVNFLGSQYSEYAIAIGESKAQQKELEKQLEVLRQQVQQIQTPHPKESFCLTVAIEPEGAGEFEIEVSYVVHSVSWTPLYDLRVNTNSSSLTLSYQAEVIQNTGEDWIGVALSLSTAKPGLGTLPPKLEPWYIDIPQPPALPVMMMRTRAIESFGDAQSSHEQSEVLEDNLIAAQTSLAEVSTQGSIVTFKLGRNCDIESDGVPHQTTIFNDDFPCSFEYVAMPRLVSFAYLQANVKNSANQAALLPGKANIFRDNIFVGTTELENIAPNQEFKVNLGIDEGLKIERDLVERQVDKKLIGNNRKITYSYRLVVTNLLNQEANLKLTEQLPVSRNEQIKVRLIRSNPPIQLGEMGILEWALNFSPEAKREIYYQFTIEYPSNLKVIGLDM
jgi:uncharacterized protein (TIGR02231 family)